MIFRSVTSASFASSSRVLGSSGVQRSSTWAYFPDVNFGAFIVSRDLYGLIGFLGKKGIYSGASHPVVQANGVAGTYTAHGGPIPRARKCQHITVHAGMLTCATQDFGNFYSAELAGRSSASSLVWGPLGKGSCTISWGFLGDLSLLGTFLTVSVYHWVHPNDMFLAGTWWPTSPLYALMALKFLAKFITHRRRLPCEPWRCVSMHTPPRRKHQLEVGCPSRAWMEPLVSGIRFGLCYA